MPPTFTDLAAAAAWFENWLLEAALPLWAGAGRDEARGSFQEALSLAGAPWPAARRGRVQTRQIWVYATVAKAGLGEDFGPLARRAYDFYRRHYLRSDGLFVRAADAAGAVTDETPVLYEQAFSLLAMAALDRLRPGSCADHAAELLAAVQPLRHAAGGFRETGEQPFQANAHMHLLEASLAWEEAGGGPAWAILSDEVAELALTRFLDPQSGVLREFFDADWRPLEDAAGGLIEPGHQFEWAWLLDRWGRARGEARARAAAERLYGHGLGGVDDQGVALGALWSDLTVREAATRIWAQTEYLKAALIFGGEAEALRAANGLAPYLQTPARGTWRDKRRADGGFVDEPAPATAFYHLVGAILPLIGRRAG